MSRIITIILLLLTAIITPHVAEAHISDMAQQRAGSYENKDTLQNDSVTLKEAIRDTWENFKETNRIEIKDTLIKYPRFIKFCIGIYNWVDRNLNTYNPEYVSGTGKNGKVRIVSDNWTDVHGFRFKSLSPMIMASDPYSNLGVQANYSILSAGYSVDLNSAISGKKSHHSKTSFGITVARFYLEAYYWRNTGQTIIRHFGNNEIGHADHVTFDGLNSKSFGIGGFYFFNYKKFSYAAAYNLSNYQLKSAGSWIAGMQGTFFDSSLDFTKLPEEVKEVTNFPFDSYRFDFNAINILGGYGYNWVINKHFLFNTTTLPGLGVAFSFSDATSGRTVNLSLSVRQLNSLTYVNRQFFLSITNNLQMNFLITRDLAFSSGLENMQLSTGVRF
ncbi:MAG: DUF4421 domain-containing protein [Bacteroidales bacterium]|nr:DUF4421 domain-containing protein [Bacteroidales bacterium]